MKKTESKPSIHSNTVGRDVVNFTRLDRQWENDKDKSLTVTLCRRRRRLQTGSTCAALWHAQEVQRFLFTPQATSRNFYQWHACASSPCDERLWPLTYWEEAPRDRRSGEAAEDVVRVAEVREVGAGHGLASALAPHEDLAALGLGSWRVAGVARSNLHHPRDEYRKYSFAV